MKSKILLLTALLLGATIVVAQEKSFVIHGAAPLPDGYNAAICCHTDTSFAEVLAEDWIKDGQFTLKGVIDKPYQGTLMTNNLQLVEQHQWPEDSIRWTYTEVFLSPDELHTIPMVNEAGELQLVLTGTSVQDDYNEYMKNPADQWHFIEIHPQSVISTWLACQLTDRAYNLTAEEVALLESTVKGSPADTARLSLFQQKIAAAKKTVKNSPLTDLELVGVNGQTCQLVDVVPNNGKYVLIDFWASWCGICLHSMPDVAKLAEDYSDRFCVIGVSIDTKPEAWYKAMTKHPEPWPQYCTTPKGYQDLFTKYQVGNGVPYYLLLSPGQRVIASPERPEDVREWLEVNN